MSAVLPDHKSTPEHGALTKVTRALQSVGHYLQAEYAERGFAGVWGSCVRLGGVLINYAGHREMERVLQRPGIKDFGHLYPRLSYRYTLPYLSSDFGWHLRWELIHAHYAFVSEVLSTEFSTRVLNGTMGIWQTGAEGHELSVSVGGLCPVTRHREGELTLCFNVDGVAVYHLSFSVVRARSLRRAFPLPEAGSEHVIYVGRVQGVPGSFDPIRLATRLMGDVAPADALMAALAGLAKAWGIEAVVGVGSDTCISQHTIRRSESCFDYAQFWSKFAGRALKGGHTWINLPIAEKPLEEIVSKHRGRTLRKREFKQKLAQQVVNTMRPMAQRHLQQAAE